jgi:predicted nucleic acid-binding protein
MTVTLLDSGPLVAYLNRKDQWHSWAVRQFQNLRPPLLTCEAVLAESCFLVERNGGAGSDVMQLLKRGVFHIAIAVQCENASLETLMKRYAETPMSLADACLVRLSELHGESRTLTLNSDFRQYRRNGRQIIPLLAPWQ